MSPFVVQQGLSGGLFVVFTPPNHHQCFPAGVPSRRGPQWLELSAALGADREHEATHRLDDLGAEGGGLHQRVVGDELEQVGWVDVAKTDFLEEVVDCALSWERVVVDPRQEGLKHLLLLRTEPVVFEVAHELREGQLAEVLCGGDVGETPHRHLLCPLPQTLTVEDLRESNHAQTVFGAQLLLQEHGAGLEETSVVKHGGCLHEWEHDLHGDGDAARVDVVHDATEDIWGDPLQVHSRLTALQKVAAEHGSEIRAAGDQDVPVAGDLLVLGAEQDVCQDALLPEDVELGQKMGGKFWVFERENFLRSAGHSVEREASENRDSWDHSVVLWLSIGIGCQLA